MKSRTLLLDFLIREWLLLGSITGLVASSLYLKRIPHYDNDELVSIFLLLALFIVVKGIENSGILSLLGERLETSRWLAPKLVTIAFALSLVVTIDASLVVMIPLVLSLNVKHRDSLVILVALTAHTGAALTPFGTPQNLFIYSLYDVDTLEFFKTISPFSLGMFAVFLVVSLFLKTSPKHSRIETDNSLSIVRSVLFGLLLLLVVICVLRWLPPVTAVIAMFAAAFIDRRSFLVDYSLLLTFLCFIGLADNVGEIIANMLENPHHLFLLAAILSQFISNVPTTLLLTEFTDQWKPLLWGVNVGGFGSLMA
ncbi:MAG TPA: hypothetical protein ENJ35_10495, partial [Gammaproteobacteria bacterium]|nr:hypothetical protein [Gammaproteobacteria bacterium]